MNKKNIDKVIADFKKAYPLKVRKKMTENQICDIADKFAASIWPVAQALDEKDEVKIMDYVWKKTGFNI